MRGRLMGGRFIRVNSWDVRGWNEEVVSFIGDNIKIYGRCSAYMGCKRDSLCSLIIEDRYVVIINNFIVFAILFPVLLIGTIP